MSRHTPRTLGPSAGISSPSGLDLGRSLGQGLDVPGASAAGGGGGGSGVSSFNEIAYLSYDLSAEGFSDTTSIATLTDQSGNGRNASHGTVANQPVAQTDTGMAVARFDGADLLETSAFASAVSQPATYIALARRTGGTASRLLDGISNNRHLMYLSAGNWAMNGGSVLAGDAYDTNWHVFVFLFNTTSSGLYVDGGAAQATGNVGTNTITGLTVGNNYGGSPSGWVGDINFVGMYDGDLVADDLALLNATCQALADRIGVTWTDIA